MGAASAHAAEVTQLPPVSDRPVSFRVEVAYRHADERALLTRERRDFLDAARTQPGIVDAPELRYRLIENRLRTEAAVGFFGELQLHLGVDVVLAQNRSWGYPRGVSAANSSVGPSCMGADGAALDPTCLSTGAGAQPLFAVPNASFRNGLANPRFGVSYALLNGASEPDLPTWMLRLDYEAPTARRLEPARATSPAHRGGIGDRVHKLELSTAFSKRFTHLEPYVRAGYVLPIRGSGYYSNCEAPQTLARPASCGTLPWSRAQTGIVPAHLASMWVGTEIAIAGADDAQGRVALDLRGTATYASASRSYNPLSDLTGRLLATQDSVKLAGSLGAVAQAGKYLGFTVRAGISHETDRVLTEELIGIDGPDANRSVDTANTAELNPSYDFRVDAPSRRFKARGDVGFQLETGVRVAF
jgi:hypothetical protein